MLTDSFIPTFLILFIVFLLGLLIGDIGATSRMQQEAVKNNAAVWQADSNGKVIFVWITEE